jgi:hypothetical protein
MLGKLRSVLSVKIRGWFSTAGERSNHEVIMSTIFKLSGLLVLPLGRAPALSQMRPVSIPIGALCPTTAIVIAESRCPTSSMTMTWGIRRCTPPPSA